MRFTFRISILFIFTVSFNASGFSTTTDLPIDSWVKSLSVKKDPHTEQFRKVNAELIALDSAGRCEAIKLLESRRADGNERFKIRSTLMAYYVSENWFYCADIPLPEERLDQAIRSAYELEDDVLLYELHSIRSALYFKHAQYGRTILHGRLASEILERVGKEHFYVWSSNLYVFAYALYYAREYRECIDLCLALVKPEAGAAIYDDSILKTYAVNTWNMLGLCYEKINEPDSAFIAFENALVLLDPAKDWFWTTLIRGNQGDVYYQLGKYDTARVLLQQDFENSMTQGEYGNAGNSLQWIARIDLHQGRPAQAYEKLMQAKQLVAALYKPEFMANVLFALSSAHARIGNADSAEIVLQQYLTLHDSIEQVASDSKSAIIKMQLQNLSDVHTIKELNKAKRRVSMVRNFMIGFVLLLALSGYLLMNRQQLKLKLKQHAALEAQTHAERETAVAKEQLTVYTQHILEKTKLVDDLQNQLSEFEASESQQEKISKLSRHVILTEADWTNFKNLFEKVYPGFFHQLKLQSADITLAEQRMAALSKLQLSVKESADLLGISANSVHKNRQRLRTRLGLEPDADLNTYFADAQTKPGTHVID